MGKVNVRALRLKVSDKKQYVRSFSAVILMVIKLEEEWEYLRILSRIEFVSNNPFTNTILTTKLAVLIWYKYFLL